MPLFADEFGDEFGDFRSQFDIGGDLRSEFGRPRKSKAPVLTPEQETSFLTELAGGAMGAASTAGHILDTAGAGARGLIDLATGGDSNPLEMMFNPEKRIYGREQLEKWGAVGPNEDQGYIPDVADLAGFAYDIGTDPLTYLTGGLSALGKSGKILKGAGLLEDAFRVAGKAGVGKRAARLTTSIDDFLRTLPGHALPDAEAALGRAAQGAGTTLDAVRGDKLGSLFRFGIGDASIPLGTGDLAQSAARGMDAVGSAARWSGPGRYLASVFDSSNMGATTRPGQEFAQELFAKQSKVRQQGRQMTQELTQALSLEHPDLLANTQDAKEMLARIAERADGGMPIGPQTQAAFTKQWDALKELKDTENQWGINVAEQRNLARGEYYPAELADIQNVKRHSGKFGPNSAVDPASLAKADILRGIEGRQGQISQIARDADLNDMIGRHQQMLMDGADPQALAAAGVDHQSIALQLRQKYGNSIPPTWEEYLDKDIIENGVVKHKKGERLQRHDRDVELAKYLTGLSDEVRKTGIYSHPMDAFARRYVRGSDAAHAAKQITERLADSDFLAAAWKDAKSPRAVEANSFFAKLGIDSNTGANNLASIMGIQPSDAGKILIPEHLVDDLARTWDGFTNPKVVDDVVSKIIAPLTNTFKANVTAPFPAFHVRNLISGMFRNWHSGLIDTTRLPGAIGDTLSMIRGGEIKGATQIPEVAERLARLGLPATDAHATDVLRGMAYEFGVSGSHQGEAAARVMPGEVVNSVADQIPGGFGGSKPYKPIGSIPDIVKGSSPNPLNVRGGFGGQTESKFAPVKYGEMTGEAIENMNRVAPFIEMLRKGIAPAEAAKRVLSAQVEYGGRAYSPIERGLLSSIFPFYKFQKGQVPYVLNELLEKPGGKLAAFLKTQGKLAETERTPVPDYVREGTAIPLGKLDDGTRRYLSGLGLMHEDPLALLLAGGPKGTALEMISRTNPLIKGPLEYASGHSFFQHGQDALRPVEDMDPLLGRLAANIGSLTGLRDDKKAIDLPNIIEQAAANSPITRYLSTARTLTDPRKYKGDALGIPGGAMLLNLASGLRVTDVSPESQQRTFEQLAAAKSKELGAKSFARQYFPKDAKAEMSPELLREVQLLEALQRSFETKARKAAKERKQKKSSAELKLLGL